MHSLNAGSIIKKRNKQATGQSAIHSQLVFLIELITRQNKRLVTTVSVSAYDVYIYQRLILSWVSCARRPVLSRTLRYRLCLFCGKAFSPSV